MIEYVHLIPDSELPQISHLGPYKAIVLVEESVTPIWQAKVSDWLVRSGCLYMMAWGKDCSSWDDSVDMANIETFNFGDVPESKAVMTTWHESEALNEVFWFAKHSAHHPTVALPNTVIVHVAQTARCQLLVAEFENA